MKRKWLIAIPLAGLIFLGRQYVFSKTKMVEKKEPIKIPSDTLKIDTLINVDDTFSIVNFKKYLEQIGMPHPHVAYSIAKHESHFSSNLFRSNNNLFGMRNPKRRPTLSIQKGDGWAKFQHWTHSVDDFMLYMKFTGTYELTESQFLSRIDSKYANRSGYSKTLRRYFSEYKSIK
jgi:uncharacterized FlgJ-related protein